MSASDGCRVVGSDGPSALISGRVCWRLHPALDAALERAKRDGRQLDDEVIDAVALIGRVATAYAVRQRGTSGTLGIPPNEPRRIVATMTASEVANELGCTPRNVTALARRGSLIGRRTTAGWTFPRTAVEEYARRREA